MTDQLPTDQVPDKSLDSMAQCLDSLIQTFEQHPIVQVRNEVMEMLGLIDALHREGLRHLVEALSAQGSGLVEQALKDPAVHMLLMLYDLLPPEPRVQVEQALETVGPYIASLGGSVEVLDVIDGVVHLHLSGTGSDFAASQATLWQHIEAALREGFPGFRSIEVHELSKLPVPARAGSFIPLQQVRSVTRTVKRPVFTSVASMDSLEPDTLKGIEVEGVRVLLCNVDGAIYAYRNACPGSILPLDGGKLKGYSLLCPWHNCLYDMRTGKRLDGYAGQLEVIPVAIRDRRIELALHVESMSVNVLQAVGRSGAER